MSRLYMIQVHVKAEKEKHEEILDALDHWGAFVGNRGEPWQFSENECLVYEGEITLGGGKDEHEAHLELKEILPSLSSTKWKCMEFSDWDEVICDDK
jgi:hypothetical protein